MKILLFSPPFYGHLNNLLYLRDYLESQNYNDINLIITGWDNIIPNISNKKNVYLINKHNINSSDPLTFTLDRINLIIDDCLELSKKINPDLIIYDFFSIEGFIIGKLLGVPTFCSIPAMIGPFIKDVKENKFFNIKLNTKNNMNIIKNLELKYNINLLENNIQQVSDGILIPSVINILWSYDNIIKSDDYLFNRNLTDDNFIIIGSRNNDLINSTITELSDNLIYISFGTVVTQNLWDKQIVVREFIKTIMEYIKQILGNSKYQVIISTGRNVEDVIENPPNNFILDRTFPQIEILKKAKLFITHGGGNSFNEAIQFNVPMISIPFFGDQHLISYKIEKMNLGKAFLHDKCNIIDYVDTENNPFYRKSLNKITLEKSINDIMKNHDYYVENIKSSKKVVKNNINDIFKIYNNYPLKLEWKNGDLLFGTNIDRNKLIKYLKLDNEFKACQYLPFSKLFEDNNDIDLLPKIIDIYNDSLFDDNIFNGECNSKFLNYSKNLKEFREFLQINKKFLLPALSFENINDNNKLETIWSICIGGIEFFTQVKKHNIHFVIDTFNKNINKATNIELTFIKDNWSRFRKSISFYILKFENTSLIKVNPENYNFFI